MKKILLKLTSVILALLMLASCTPKNAGSVSSSATEHENQSTISSTDSKHEVTSKVSDSSIASTVSEFTLNRDEYLSEEKIREISACIQKDNYEYMKGESFGTYNGYDVILISQIAGVEYRDEHIMKIGEYNFFIGDTEKLIAYKDNSYILLSEVYEQGIIEKDDIENIKHDYSKYYSDIIGDRIEIVVKKDTDNPDKKYTPSDFPTIKIEKIIQSRWSSYESGEKLTIVLPISNRRNVINSIKKLKKQNNVLSAKPDGVSYFT